jgi:hypothetical protein
MVETSGKVDDRGENMKRNMEMQDVSMHLMICGILPVQTDVTYREKQALNLVSYHLQKFASEVNCTLCFMRDEKARQGVTGDVGEEKSHIEEEKESHGLENDGEVQVREDAFRPKGLSVKEFL